MCILFFTMVYMSIYKLFGGTSFEGENIGQDLLSQFITFLYFSMATFVTVGYGDVAPIDNTSRLVVVLEIAFSFITVAYALSMLGTHAGFSRRAMTAWMWLAVKRKRRPISRIEESIHPCKSASLTMRLFICAIGQVSKTLVKATASSAFRMPSPFLEG